MKQFWTLNRLIFKMNIYMKKFTLLSVLLILFQAIILGQGFGKNGKLIYTIGYNEVPARCNLPLIGFVNMAHGDQKSIHVGLINTNTGNLSGAQIGLVNTVGDKMDGIQVALVNTTGDDQRGLQVSLINTVGDNVQGFQVGLINTVGDNVQGLQVSLINTIGGKMQGSQIGLINTVEKLEGLQVGLINMVGTVTHGVPIGLLSFVRHGGYQAFELSFNEMYPYNASYKIGMDKFYTFPMVSYNPNLVDPWAIGFGAGSVVPMNEEVFFNPELSTQTILSKDYQQITSLVLNFGHTFTENIDFLAGPSIVWNKTTANDPLFSLHSWDIDRTSRIHVGLRAALRYRF